MIFVKENVYHNDDRHFFQSKYFFKFAIKSTCQLSHFQPPTPQVAKMPFHLLQALCKSLQSLKQLKYHLKQWFLICFCSYYLAWVHKGYPSSKNKLIICKYSPQRYYFTDTFYHIIWKYTNNFMIFYCKFKKILALKKMGSNLG